MTSHYSDWELMINSGEAGRKKLAAGINEMISNDFTGLINLLYRFDIDEKRLRELLKPDTAKEAGMIIADLLIERQIQRQRSKKEFNKNQNEIDEKEKW
jgi:hypothetical protein